MTEFASTKAQDGLTCFERERRRHAVSLPRRTATGDEQGSQVAAREGKCGEERRDFALITRGGMTSDFATAASTPQSSLVRQDKTKFQ